MKYFYLLIICFIVSNFLQAQDFAFNHLDHDSRYNSIVSLFKYDGGVIYSVNNDQKPMMRVVHVNLNGIATQLMEHPYLTHGKAKYYLMDDGSVEVYIYDLFDYDFIGPGYFRVNYDGQAIDTLHLYDENNYGGVTALERLDNGNVKTYDSWQGNEPHIVVTHDPNGNPIESLVVENGVVRMFKNDLGDLFYRSRDLILKESNGVLDTVYESTGFPSLLKSRSDEFIVYVDDLIHVFNEDFSDLKFTMTLPEGLSTRFEDVATDGDTFYFILTEDNLNFDLYSYTQMNEFQKVFDQENYRIREIEINNGEFTLGGLHRNESFMTLIEEIDLDSTLQYKTIDISLDNIELIFERKDTAYVDILSSGDTIIHYDYYYDYEFTVTNRGNEDIYNFDVYSNQLAFGFKPKYLHHHVDEILSPNETKTYTGVKHTFNPVVGEKVFYIPGANNKFDSDYSDNVIDFEVISSVDDRNVMEVFKVFPNPTDNIVFVDGLNLSEKYSYNISDKFGRTIEQAKLNYGTITLDNFPVGMYFLSIFQNNKLTSVNKLIKH